MRYMIFICLASSPLKVNINAFPGLLLKQSPSNLLFSKVFQGNNRKEGVISSCFPLNLKVSAATEGSWKDWQQGYNLRRISHPVARKKAPFATGEHLYVSRRYLLSTPSIYVIWAVVNYLVSKWKCCWWHQLVCKVLMYESLHAVIKSLMQQVVFVVIVHVCV